MNTDKALKIMNINKHTLYSLDHVILKKKYHQLALKLHPDKGGTNNEFRQLQEAYDYLNIMVELNTFNTSPYENYINNSSTNFEYKYVINKLKKYIFKYIKSVSMSYINECDDKQFENLEKILEYYKDKIPPSVYNKIISTMNTSNNCKNFILKPTIDDLLENKIYRLNYNNEIFNVPLWHSELYYDTKDNDEICVKCIPELNPFIDIDSDNNIHIYIFENINTLFKNQYIDIQLSDNFTYKIHARDITILPCQKIILKNKGITKISNKNLYDTNYKSDIIVTLNIH